VAAVALLALLAGCSTPYPWQKDVFDLDRVKELKTATPGPMKFRAGIALRVDPATWEAGPVGQFRSVADHTGKAVKAIRTAADAALEAQSQASQGFPALAAEMGPISDRIARLAKTLAGREKKAGWEGGVSKAVAALASCGKNLKALAAEAPKVGSFKLKEIGERMNSLDEALTAGDDVAALLSDLADKEKSVPARAKAMRRVAESLAAIPDLLLKASTALSGKQSAPLSTHLTAAGKVLMNAQSTLARLLPRAPSTRRDQELLVRAGRTLASYKKLAGKAYGRAADLSNALGTLKKDLAQNRSAAALANRLKPLWAAFSAEVKAAAKKDQGTSGDGQVFLNAVLAAKALGSSLNAVLGAESLKHEDAVALLTALGQAQRAAEAAVESAKAASERGNHDEAAIECRKAAQGLAAFGTRLTDMGEAIAGDAEPSLSLPPDPKAFCSSFSEVLNKFGMFKDLEEMADIPPAAGQDVFLAEARRKGLDILVFLEVKRNDVNHLGFNSNHWYNLLIWSFAWFASNFVPDETWESHITLDLRVVDVRSGQNRLPKEIDSKAALNLSDADDGYHFLGIVFGSCDQEDLRDASAFVLPYHLTQLKALVLEELTVAFRKFTGTEEFERRRSLAPPDGFALTIGVSRYADPAFNRARLSALRAAKTLAASAEKAASTLDSVAKSLKVQASSPASSAVFEGADALRKAERLATLGADELERRDVPTAMRSISQAVIALADAAAKFKGIPELGPLMEKGLLGNKGLKSGLDALGRKVKSFKTQKGFLGLVNRQDSLLKNSREVPDDIGKIRVELSGKEKAEKGLQEAVRAMKDAQAMLAEALERFKQSDLDGGKKAQEAAYKALTEAKSLLIPFKAMSVNMPAVIGKIDFLIDEQKKAKAESSKVKVDPAVKATVTAIRALAGKISALAAKAGGDVKKAGSESKDRQKMGKVLGRAGETAREAARVLGAAAKALEIGDRLAADEPLAKAVGILGGLATELKPLVEGRNTLVGAILAEVGRLETMAINVQQKMNQTSSATPQAEGKAIAKSVRELADVVDGYVTTLEKIRQKNRIAMGGKRTRELGSLLGTLSGLARAQRQAADRFELNDIPGGQIRIKTIAGKLAAFRSRLAAFAKIVPAVGAVVFALDGTAEHQRAVARLATRSSERAALAYKKLGESQNSFAAYLLKIEAAFSQIEKVYAKSRSRVPDVFRALSSARSGVRRAAAQLGSAGAAFKKGDGLGGARDVKTGLAMAAEARDKLMAAVEGKKTAIEFLREVITTLEKDRLGLVAIRADVAAEAAEGAVAFAARDATDIAALLAGPRGFNPAGVRSLTDADATIANLRAALGEAAANRVQPKDLFVLSFSGIGALRKVVFFKRDEIIALLADMEKAALELRRVGDDAGKVTASKELVKAASEQAAHARDLEALQKALEKVQTLLASGKGAGLGDAISATLGEIAALRKKAEDLSREPKTKDFSTKAISLIKAWKPLAERLAADLPAVPEEADTLKRCMAAQTRLDKVLGDLRGLVTHLTGILPGKKEKSAAKTLVTHASTLAKKLPNLAGPAKDAASTAVGELEKAAPAAEAAGAALAVADLRRALTALEKVLGAKTQGLSGAIAALAPVSEFAIHHKELVQVRDVLTADLKQLRGLLVDPQGPGSGAKWEKKLDGVSQAALEVQSLVLPLTRLAKRFARGKNADATALFINEQVAADRLARAVMGPRETLQSDRNWGEALRDLTKASADFKAMTGRLKTGFAQVVRLAASVAGAPNLQKALDGAAAKIKTPAAAARSLGAFAAQAAKMEGKMKTAAADLLAREKAKEALRKDLADALTEIKKALAGAYKTRDLLRAGQGKEAFEAASAVGAVLEASGKTLLRHIKAGHGMDSLAKEAARLALAEKKVAQSIKVAKPSSGLVAMAKSLGAATARLDMLAKKAEALSLACKNKVPEPARTTEELRLGLHTAAGILAEAANAAKANDLPAARKKLAAGLELLVKGSTAVRKLGETMKDLYARYLMLHDSDPARPGETAISLYELAGLVEKLGARRAVILLDTSFAPQIGPRSRGVLGDRIPPKALNTAHMADLCRGKEWVAAKAGGPAHFAVEDRKGGHGLFTLIVLEGFAGAADRDGDGRVSWAEIAAFAAAKSNTAKSQQTPLFLGSFEGDTLAFQTPAKAGKNPRKSRGEGR
jgi:hypothetical protein